jgi:phosphatidylinositol alpha-1,6-mannosyltransferase
VRVLFISKPIAPPFQDGTKCLVRDIATRLEQVEPVVLSVPGAPELAIRSTGAGVPRGTVRMVPVYANAGSYAPALAQNLRAAAWVLLRSRADVWHFVFAPNARTSRAGRWLSQRKRRPVVQTIASPPRSFRDAEQLLFGDIVVAQSRWTERQVRAAYDAKGLSPPVLRVIPPPVPEGLVRSASDAALARERLAIPPGVPLFVYPGDLEVSSGAEVVAQIAERIRERVPDAVVVFAYRRKTAAAGEVAARLDERLQGRPVRFADSLPDVLALLASATAVLFPVDDLWGKVDLPIVLLEAMALEVPVVALDAGPLSELEGARLLSSLDVEAWLDALGKLVADSQVRRGCIEQQRTTLARCSAAAVARAYEQLYLELGASGQAQARGRAPQRPRYAPPLL